MPASARRCKAPRLQALAQQLGIGLAGGPPEQLDRVRRADFDKWGALIRNAGIKPA
ncbi:hypothetical protein [Achromobacter sp. DMS1]|uniref:hypothetical protein n=1 Tax=Achromobacter sp. DMS1 TaxID=1688405 RepID=UPI00350FD8E2